MNKIFNGNLICMQFVDAITHIIQLCLNNL